MGQWLNNARDPAPFSLPFRSVLDLLLASQDGWSRPGESVHFSQEHQNFPRRSFYFPFFVEIWVTYSPLDQFLTKSLETVLPSYGSPPDTHRSQYYSSSF